MQNYVNRKGAKRFLLLAASIAGLAIATSSVGAQEYYSGPQEQVIVTPPHYGPQRSEIGAPIVDASMSQAVRYDDLDLRTAWGARTLRDRIRFAATTLCNRLDAMYPVSVDDTSGMYPGNTRCYRDAAGPALYEADSAIRNARSYSP
jgi:UrcA family protein